MRAVGVPRYRQVKTTNVTTPAGALHFASEFRPSFSDNYISLINQYSNLITGRKLH